MSEHQYAKMLKTTDRPTKQKAHMKQPLSQHTHPATIIQRAHAGSLTHADALHLQRTIGNRAAAQLMSEIGGRSSAQNIPIQRQVPEEEEELQMKVDPAVIQRQEPEEEELLQGKMTQTIQRQPEPEEEELLQPKLASGLTGTLQTKEEAPSNETGMPNNLKSGLEKLSGMDLSGVRVHYNSSKPMQLNALAYTQGRNIHVAPGQEQHLPHEGWHAVQQMQGRVNPKVQTKGVTINDDLGLEKEADVMGETAKHVNNEGSQSNWNGANLASLANSERARKLPDELAYKAKSGDRARTWEETQIDLFGTGSALNSLVNSPGQTLTNAFKGLFSGFPSRSTIRKQAAVQTAIGTAWTAAQGDYSERFGWITWNKTANTYAVPAVSVGDQYSCTPTAKPVDPAPGSPNQVFHVGEFHIHPPLDPGEPAMANPRDWPIGPSTTDERAAQADNSPGIVRDFDTIDRNGGVTDYTYGPWKRTE